MAGQEDDECDHDELWEETQGRLLDLGERLDEGDDEADRQGSREHRSGELGREVERLTRNLENWSVVHRLLISYSFHAH